MKKYKIITIGCQMNKSDSERIGGYLENLGMASTEKLELADLVVVTTCGVRQSAEDRIYGLIPKIKSANKDVKIVLTGCLANREDLQKRMGDRVDIWMPIVHLPELDKLLGFKKHESYKEYLEISPKYNSKFSAFVPIGNGCNNFCAYCFVPYARGREVYRPAVDIVDEVRDLVDKGYREIVLIAQNVNSYKSQITNYKLQTNYKSQIQNTKQELNFSDLLRKVNDIPGEFWVRFATSHPKDMSDELIKTVAECVKVCEHIHLPVQAGDDAVLKRMNRKYTIQDYVGLVKKIRSILDFRKTHPAPPGHPSQEGNYWQSPVAITTDIIVGFPGETDEQFQGSVELFKEVKFDMAYIAQYSPRPHTAAQKMADDVSREEKKRREVELMKILSKTALENNKKYVGRVVEVLVENRKGDKLIGKTRTGKMVKFEISNLKFGKYDFLGEFAKVKITDAQDFGLAGKLLNK